jgi:hypothetical protein
MFLAVNIWGDFPMIPFLILTGIFFISDAPKKTQSDAHLVAFNIGVKMKKIDLVHTLCQFSCISLSAKKLWDEHAQLCLCEHAKLNQKL